MSERNLVPGRPPAARRVRTFDGFSRGLTALVIASLTVLIAYSPCAAQGGVRARRDAEAHSLFEAGRSAFQDGRYDDALARFQEAYELSHRPELLYNIGQSADRLRRDAIAIDAFARYLDEVPNADNHAEVAARLRSLREATAVAAEAGAVPPQPLLTAPAVPAPRATPIYEEWWLWTVIGAVVVLGVAIPVGVAAGSHTETRPFVTGDVGPGGIVIALDGP